MRKRTITNTEQYIVTDSDIGDVEVTHKKGLKNFNIRLRPFLPVQISAPHRATRQQVLVLIENKKSWILQKQLVNHKVEKAQSTFDVNQQISLHYHTIDIVRGTVSKLRIKGTAPSLQIEVPEVYNTKSAVFQEQVKELIVYILRLEAQKYLPCRIKELAEKHNFSYSKLTLRNNKTNWGSCSGKGDISLNIQLMRLPSRLIDYVIVHELCHTIHHNHGLNFKSLLMSIIPETPMLEREMKKYRTQTF